MLAGYNGGKHLGDLHLCCHLRPGMYFGSLSYHSHVRTLSVCVNRIGI